MHSEIDPSSPLRFSLDDLPAGDRLDFYREVVGRGLVGSDIAPIAGTPLVADLSLTALPDLRILSGRVGGSVISRDGALLADGNDDFGLAIGGGGTWMTTSRGRELDHRTSHAQLNSMAEPFQVTVPTTMPLLILQVPRRTIAALAPNVDDQIMRPLSGAAPVLDFLKAYVGLLERPGAVATPELRNLAATHIHDLMALAIGASSGVEEIARRRGLAAARLQALKADVVANLHRGALSVDWIAERHRMTARSVQRLFEREGVTFSAFVLARRLERAHAMLSERKNRDESIAAVAFLCGFGDVSYFNRQFRRAYLVTPGEVRAEAIAMALAKSSAGADGAAAGSPPRFRSE